MLVHDGRNSPHRADETAERRGTVAVQMQDVDLFGVDDRRSAVSVRGSNFDRSRYVMSTPRVSSVSSEGPFSVG